jgi:hypothetical protein
LKRLKVLELLVERANIKYWSNECDDQMDKERRKRKESTIDEETPIYASKAPSSR